MATKQTWSERLIAKHLSTAELKQMALEADMYHKLSDDVEAAIAASAKEYADKGIKIQGTPIHDINQL